MDRYLTKRDLYKKIQTLRGHMHLSNLPYPIDLVEYCNHDDQIEIERVPFKTNGLQGMAVLPDKYGEKDIIMLNSKQSSCESNFYCAHELIHLNIHRDGKGKTFNCYEKARPYQDKYLEWQANEGAAELIAPYEEILKIIGARKDKFNNWWGIEELKSFLCKNFFVSEAFVKYRLESLKYEIYQYLNGVDFNRIKVLSQFQLSKLGFTVDSLNDRERVLLEDIFKESPMPYEDMLITATHAHYRNEILEIQYEAVDYDIGLRKAEEKWLYDV